MRNRLLQARYSAIVFCLLAAISLQPCFGQAPQPHAFQAWSRSASQSTDGFYFQPDVIGEDYPQATRRRVLDDISLARRVGARALRFGVSWLDTEPEPQNFDWSKLDIIVDSAHQQHMAVIPYICYTPKWAASDPGNEDFWSYPPRDPQ